MGGGLEVGEELSHPLFMIRFKIIEPTADAFEASGRLARIQESSPLAQSSPPTNGVMSPTWNRGDEIDGSQLD